ncbi:MAG: toxin-antitoxin system YwqK family antitoxin [Planctomycetota bacterium]
MQLRQIFLALGVIGIAGWAYNMRVSAAAREVPAQTSYYANGQLRSHIEYRDGQRQGLSASWYASGAKQAEGTYTDGQMEGSWTFWLPDGSLDVERSGLYRDGLRLSDSSTLVANSSGS